MKKYKGYYVDGVIFKNEKEIDEFHKNSAIENFRQFVWLFAKYKDMESSTLANEAGEKLVNNYGLTWNQVEELEIEVLNSLD